tara:strand:- start:316 stop:948 length:633 start_codon:yes stop_codon:yes gene_type:complete
MYPLLPLFMRTYLSKESILLIAASLLIIAACYYHIIPDPQLYFVTVWMYFFVVPLGILLLLGEKLHSYGFIWKKWPFRKDKTILSLVALIAVMYGASALPQFESYYTAFTPTKNIWFHSIVVLGSFYFAEEFFFRGFLLFGLKERFGEFAVVLQAVPFALFHIGKPPLEAVISIFAGMVFGHIAYKSESFIPTFLIHWLMGLAIVVFISL